MLTKFKAWLSTRSLTIPLAALLLLASGASGAVALAHADTGAASGGQPGAHHTRPAAVGTVSAISGTTITLSDKGGPNGATATTYTVDASSATVTKDMKPTTQGGKASSSTIAVSDIAVGDMIAVEGTASGTSITATAIRDGMAFGMHGKGGMDGPEHGVHGTVSAVNGSTLTVTGSDGKTYTVNASSTTAARFETISASAIGVGDTVTVDGTVSGTNVTAKMIMDGAPMHQ